ncbi:MAG: 2'-5' RNA ligase family protein [Clostridiaceae bacterium]|nr:2'-5' RNA ligase family protein [Clostridiaceae bacterium]
MSEKFLCIIATFDEETSKGMKEIYHSINEAGIIGKQTTDIPHHITLAYFETRLEDEIRELLQEVCARTKSFDLSFNHIGLFGLKVLFLAPNVNYELLQLHKDLDRDGIKSSQGWTAHTTILIDETEIIQKALPLVAQSFQQLNGRVESVSLYEFFPTRFIAKFNLQ